MLEVGKNIDLIVITSTYNHEKYIAQCLESALSQKTQYSFQILVIDDASTDKTQDIVRDYQAQYPDKILAVLHDKNYGIACDAFEAANIKLFSKYFAFLEGDDYWCNPNKVECQINILEKNPELSGVAHATLVFHENNTDQNYEYRAGLPSWTIHDMIEGKYRSYCHTSSWIRKRYSEDVPLEPDYLMSFLFAEKGPVHYIDEVMSVYRITGKGSWTSLSPKEQCKKNLESFDIIDKALGYKYHTQLQKRKRLLRNRPFFVQMYNSVIPYIRKATNLKNRLFSRTKSSH